MKEKIINLLGIRPNGTIVCRIDTIRGPRKVIMRAITEEEENRIDKSKIYFGDIRYETKDFIVKSDDIYLYGEVDFDNEDDLFNIAKFNLINERGNHIYSTFDYNKGSFVTQDGVPKMYETWDPILWFKYCHCLIGKPKRIIVYKDNKIVKC